MNDAISDLQTLPISSRLLRATHLTLLSNGRGEHKQPGEFRRSQNWIGGHSLADAAFIPPHHDLVADLMGDLETFLHNDDINVPKLIRIGKEEHEEKSRAVCHRADHRPAVARRLPAAAA